ncbi:MAG: hypothetical protein HRU12_18805 [Phaeodactylibacter sp.]|nr:hypothetical protein [Phaeodactylibacter sp.]
MKYDNEYYLPHEVEPASSYMLVEAEGTDEGLFSLMSRRSIKRLVLGNRSI